MENIEDVRKRQPKVHLMANRQKGKSIVKPDPLPNKTEEHRDTQTTLRSKSNDSCLKNLSLTVPNILNINDINTHKTAMSTFDLANARPSFNVKKSLKITEEHIKSIQGSRSANVQYVSVLRGNSSAKKREINKSNANRLVTHDPMLGEKRKRDLASLDDDYEYGKCPEYFSVRDVITPTPNTHYPYMNCLLKISKKANDLLRESSSQYDHKTVFDLLIDVVKKSQNVVLRLLNDVFSQSFKNNRKEIEELVCHLLVCVNSGLKILNVMRLIESNYNDLKSFRAYIDTLLILSWYTISGILQTSADSYIFEKNKCLRNHGVTAFYCGKCGRKTYFRGCNCLIATSGVFGQGVQQSESNNSYYTILKELETHLLINNTEYKNWNIDHMFCLRKLSLQP